MAESKPDTWQDALTRRLRTLLRTAPLHRVESGKGQRGSRFSEQDLRALALRALDLTIERMGLGSGATLSELREGLRPLVLMSADSLTHDEADGIADAVVEALLNEPHRRQAFVEPYLSVDADDASRKVLSFHLLRERETGDGETVIVATTEGVNLYAGMLEYPVEDAQVAEEAVLQSQVRRGRIADAVRTAGRARVRSIEYEQKIIAALETTRRDIQQVDWLDGVLTMLDGAREHIVERLRVEREIHLAVERRVEAVTDDSAAHLVALRETLDECMTRHSRLHERLIGANRTYLEEQERQSFRPRLVAPLPDLESDVLRVALQLPVHRVASMTDDGLLSRLQAPYRPTPVRLVHLIERLLAPRRDEPESPYAIEDPNLEVVSPLVSTFSESDHDTVRELLGGLARPTTLGELLARCRRAGLSEAALSLLVLRVLGDFDPVSVPAVRVERAGTPLSDPHFVGDELCLSPPEALSG